MKKTIYFGVILVKRIRPGHNEIRQQNGNQQQKEFRQQVYDDGGDEQYE